MDCKDGAEQDEGEERAVGRVSSEVLGVLEGLIHPRFGWIAHAVRGDGRRDDY